MALAENNIIKLKKVEEEIEKAKKKLIQNLFYKFTIFFIFSFLLLLLLLLFTWYYISSFCDVYINTKIHLIKDTIISFGLSMIYPFGLYLLP